MTVPRIWPRSLRVRVTILATVVTAIAVTLAGALLLKSVRSTQLAEVRGNANEAIELAASRLSAGDTYEEALRDLELPVLATDPDGQCVTTLPGRDGVTVGCSSGDGAAASEDASKTPPSVAEGSVPGTPSGVATAPEASGGGVPTDGPPQAGDRLEVETITRTVESSRYGMVELEAVTPVDQIARSVDSIRRALFLLFPLLLTCVAVAAWWLTGRTLQPVEAIRREAESIRGLNLERRLPEPDIDDEVGRLARTMNEMLGRLEQSSIRQQQFVSDASHELRSPLTAIRTDLEIALEDGAVDWPSVARAVLGEEARLEALLGDLLVLAADDESEAASAGLRERVDLEVILVEECARRRPGPVHCVYDPAEGPFVVSGSPSRLQRALGNIVDNAVRYAVGPVLVRLTTQGGEVRVDIDDDGPGIAPDDRERVFERFTRLDDGRHRTAGGAGLGLAVARTIVRRSGGAIVATESPTHGARFTVMLPISPANDA